MSHVVAIKTEIKDLNAVRAACAELGLEFKENQKTIRWFGRWMNDYAAADAAYKLGIKPEQYGTCDHAISVPGSGYDVGLLRNPETGGFKVYFDFWGAHGQAIQKQIGVGGEKLLQLYGVHKATAVAKLKGLFVKRDTAPNGSILLTVTGV